MPNFSVDQLVKPERGGDRDEEQRDLDRNREYQHDIVDTVDRATCADALERLPAK